MEVRRSDNELKMGIYKCVIVKLLHWNKFVNIWTQIFTINKHNVMHIIILDDDNKIGMYFACFNSMYESWVQFQKVTPFAQRYGNNIKIMSSLKLKY